MECFFCLDPTPSFCIFNNWCVSSGLFYLKTVKALFRALNTSVEQCFLAKDWGRQTSWDILLPFAAFTVWGGGDTLITKSIDLLWDCFMP